jgi:hypothetical protein
MAKINDAKDNPMICKQSNHNLRAINSHNEANGDEHKLIANGIHHDNHDENDDAGDFILLDRETYNSLLEEIQSTKLMLSKLASLLSNNTNTDIDELVASLNSITSNVSWGLWSTTYVYICRL